MRVKVLAFAVTMVFAAAADAQTAAQSQTSDTSSILRFRAEDPIQVRQRGFAFPVMEYTDERGARHQRKGIIASKIIAPGTLLGVGFYETTPKSRGLIGEPHSNITPRRTKRAAVGLSWRF